MHADHVEQTGSWQMSIQSRIDELGIELPDFADGSYYGQSYGKMKSHHIVGNVLYLSGHTPVRNGEVLHPGRIGSDVTVEQGYEAARLTGINMIAGIKHALGDLERVKGLIRCLCFVACEPDFNDVLRRSRRNRGPGHHWSRLEAHLVAE